MKQTTSFGFFALLMALALLITMRIQNEHLEMDLRRSPSLPTEREWTGELQGLPRGIVEPTTDMELKSLFKNSRWFAKRFLHPDVVSVYDYIFLWDEDLGVENFHPRRYLKRMLSEGLEISQPALDPDQSSGIHHRITIRNKTMKVHRRVYDFRGSLNCSDESKGPPCTGWVEGMAPVFSRAAWCCMWHLIQNDLIHGWGLDMKLGYCAQATRRSLDLRTQIRRQSTAELEKLKERWNKAVKEDKEWTDRFVKIARRKNVT